eukprot:9481650-Pyramimonas_sp.AAC.1
MRRCCRYPPVLPTKLSSHPKTCAHWTCYCWSCLSRVVASIRRSSGSGPPDLNSVLRTKRGVARFGAKVATPTAVLEFSSWSRARIRMGACAPPVGTCAQRGERERERVNVLGRARGGHRAGGDGGGAEQGAPRPPRE